MYSSDPSILRPEFGERQRDSARIARVQITVAMSGTGYSRKARAAFIYWNQTAIAKPTPNLLIDIYDPLKLGGGAVDEKLWVIFRTDTGHWEVIGGGAHLIGKIDASIAKNVAGVVSIWTGALGAETDTGENVTANNRGMYDLVYDAADKMWVQVVPANDGWEIINPQMKAMLIEFALGGALTTSTASVASCTVDNYMQGRSPGSTVTVYNKSASTGYIFEGASGNKGWAAYDDRADKYRITQMEMDCT